MRSATIVSLIIGTLAIIFAVINPMAVNIKFGFFTIDNASLPLVLISTLLLGVLVGYLVWLPARLSAKRRIRALERAAAEFAAAVEPDPDLGEQSSEGHGSDEHPIP